MGNSVFSRGSVSGAAGVSFFDRFIDSFPASRAALPSVTAGLFF